MKIDKIETEEQYNKALLRAEILFNAQKGTPEGVELDQLIDLIEAYETKHHPIERPGGGQKRT